jgi:phosphate binding protein
MQEEREHMVTWKNIGTIMLVAALLCGCGGNAALTDSTALVENGQLTPVIPGNVSGNVAITGSSTVYPLTLRMARQFRDAGSAANVAVGVVGTGGGFRAFCGGGPVDIVNASREINAEEQAACQASGREPVAFQVGIDALSVVVASNNTFVRSLTFAQLEQIFTGQASRWSEVDPSFPNEPIAVYSPGADSGTFDFFVDEALNGNEEGLLAVPGAVFSEDDEELRRGIVANQYAIGYFGYAYYRTARGKLRAVGVDAGNGPVEPNVSSAVTGEYPLARPLFIYSSAATLREKPAVAAFVSYYLQYVDLQIDDVGYFPVTDTALAESRSALIGVLQ